MLIAIMIKYPVSSLFCEGRSSSNVNYLIVIFYEKKYDSQFYLQCEIIRSIYFTTAPETTF